MSSGNAGLVDLFLTLQNEREDLARDVAFEAPDRFQLGMAFSDAPGHVGLGFCIRSEPTDSDDVQRAIGRTITASVEAVTDHLARRGRHGAHPTQRRKASLRLQPLWIIAGRQEELCGA